MPCPGAVKNGTQNEHSVRYNSSCIECSSGREHSSNRECSSRAEESEQNDSAGNKHGGHGRKTCVYTKKSNTERTETEHLKCLYTNIDGLNATKGAELQVILAEEEPHLVFLTETKFTDDVVTSQFIDCSNYTVFRRDRGTGRGGGVVILVRKELCAWERLDMECENVEVTTCDVKTRHGKITLACFYRPPNASSELNEKLCQALLKICNTSSKQKLICGDFNFREINWNQDTVKGSDSSEQAKFFHTCQDGFLYQHVREFTRARGKDDPSLLDLILTNDPMEVEQISYNAPIGKSDLCVLTFRLLMDRGDRQGGHLQRRNFYKGDYVQARQLFNSVQWEEELDGKNTEAAWDVFLKHFNDVVGKTVPMYQVNMRTRKKWMTRYISKLIQSKDSAWKEYRNSRTARHLRMYKRARNQTTAAIRKAKYNFEHKLADEVQSNPKAFFSYARNQTSIKGEVSFVMKEDGTMTSTLAETCEVMNKEFQRVFTRTDNIELPVVSSNQQENSLETIDLTIADVERALSSLKTSSAPGPDGVHPRMLKECAQALSHPLHTIFKASLTAGYVPRDWRRANVTPIFKKGDKADALNYRPISLTSVVCKVLEKLIRIKIVEHLEDISYFSQHQHGFRSGKSCLTQLLEYFADVEEILDDGDSVDAVYLDCRKAFDTVPHNHLLVKLEAAGIRGSVKTWIMRFLENREQRVTIRDSHSSWRRVWSGVPQGSVLGPTLFLIYVNDLLDNLDSSGKLFADDAKIYRRIKTVRDSIALQDDLIKLHDWSKKWLLTFNEDKCKIMHIGKKNPQESYRLGDSRLQVTEKEKDLGVLVTRDMKVAEQVTGAAAAANSMLGRIRKTFTCLDSHTLPALYKALVRPRLE